MATVTPNIGLTKPANSEYYDNWDVVENKNKDIIDTHIGSIESEIAQARGSQATLYDRLNQGMNPDGSLKAIDEVIIARSSKVYGSDIGGVDFALDDRLEAGDWETFVAREGNPALVDSMAWGADGNKSNCIVSAPTNYLTFSGSTVLVNGASTPVIANINGYRQVVSINKSLQITGGAGTYYIAMNRVVGGQVVVTGAAASGTIATYAANNKLQKFSASSTNFITSGVKPGHLLNISGPIGNLNIGTYIVAATSNEDATNLQPNEIAIVGEFVSTSSGLNFAVNDSVQPSLSFTTTPHAKTYAEVTGTIYLGRCVFDGANITSLVMYAQKGAYAGWTQITLTGGGFSISIPHNLGYFPKTVSIFGSQANDFTQPLEPLSNCEVSGGGSLQRSVISRMSDVSIDIKNATNGIFYKDFSGTAQTAGYVYVVVER